MKAQTCTRLPTPWGEFRLYLYRDDLEGLDHLLLVLGEVREREGVLTRVHSECLTGDVFGSLRCDCGAQLQEALRMIGAQGSGALVYLRQEGRGIGLLDKLRAYNLQDVGYDTVDANLELGHQPDEREYSRAAWILRDAGVRSVDLLTNNPEKIEGLSQHGVVVRQRLALKVPVHAENHDYLQTKALRMNHLPVEC